MEDDAVTLQKLLQEIERLRTNLHQVAMGKSLTDPEVIFASKMLDEMLNACQKELSKNRIKIR